MGVPETDEPRMLKLTQELFGGTDPDMQRPDASETSNAIFDFFQYFQAITAERRARPGDDLASVIANGKVNGCPLGDIETASYYIIVATAGHDTTSSTIAGGLQALIANPGELKKLKENPALLNSAIEEMIRWVTPVQHFMRTAMEDYELRGRKIKAGEALSLLYVSGNRDEDVFADPFRFRIDREPNKQIAFGYGAHVCIGQHLARMEVKGFFTELLKRLDHIEQVGEAKRVQSVFVSGLKTLPVRYSIRPN
jgi:cytochrome P450